MEHITSERLDKMRDNPHAKMQIEQRLNSLFVKMFTLYGYADTKRASYYTEHFMEKNYLLTSVEEAIEKAVESFSKAPSIKDITDLMSGTKRAEKPKDEQWKHEFEKEQELYEKYKSRYIEKYGNDSLTQLVKEWVINEHDQEHYEWITKFYPELLKGLEKTALFDFAERKRNENAQDNQ